MAEDDEVTDCSEDGSRAARAPALARRAPTVQPSFHVAGHGELRYSSHDGYIRAFCSRHGPSCQRQRTLKPSLRNAAQGRCLGSLVAWLTSAGDYATKNDHVKARGASYEDRVRARELFKALPASNVWLDYERPLRDRESEEPRKAP